MDTKELVEYTTRAKELEVAIYTQRKLMNAHKNALSRGVPEKPIKKQIVMPDKPQMPNTSTSQSTIVALWIGIVSSLFIAVFCFWAFTTDYDSGLEFVEIVFTLAIGSIAVFCYKKINSIKEADAYKIAQWEKANSEYKKAVSERELEISTINQEYENILEAYNSNIAAYNKNSDAVMNEHRVHLQMLIDALVKHYAEEVIFEKYRDIVAITSINEYLLSGRCSKLEGSDGAYNLYEMELRQNIVIGQLSSIIDRLDAIKSNQYLLYHELNKANAKVDELMRDIKDIRSTTNLTAYFSSVSALAAVSPKYIHGIVY